MTARGCVWRRTTEAFTRGYRFEQRLFVQQCKKILRTRPTTTPIPNGSLSALLRGKETDDNVAVREMDWVKGARL